MAKHAHSFRSAFALACTVAAALLAGCGASVATDVSVRDALATATPPGATIAAAYMEIVARDADTLIGAATPVADAVEMHASSEEDGMVRMRPLTSVDLAAGKTFAFHPGGAHFMLIGLHAPLAAGSTFPLTLHLSKAGDILVEVTVAAPGATPADR